MHHKQTKSGRVIESFQLVIQEENVKMKEIKDFKPLHGSSNKQM